jgi:hypothetical protein
MIRDLQKSFLSVVIYCFLVLYTTAIQPPRTRIYAHLHPQTSFPKFAIHLRLHNVSSFLHTEAHYTDLPTISALSYPHSTISGKSKRNKTLLNWKSRLGKTAGQQGAHLLFHLKQILCVDTLRSGGTSVSYLLVGTHIFRWSSFCPVACR